MGPMVWQFRSYSGLIICLKCYIQMGVVKSITHSYTWNQYLFWYIEQKNIPKIEEVLDKKPDIVNSPLTVNYKTTPLHRAAVNGSLEICKLLIEKYEADVNHPTELGETALMGAAKRDHIQVVRYLLKMGADTETVSNSALLPVEFAILSGFYQTALTIFERMKKKQLKHPIDYQQLGIQFNYRYVNYKVFVENLLLQVDPDNVPNFLVKPKRVFTDPVVDPRQTWKQWFLRQMDFKDPPLCERTELPEEMQPQNRMMGRMHHYLSRMALSHKSQKPSLYPVSQSQVDSRQQIHYKKEMQEHVKSEEIEMKTVS